MTNFSLMGVDLLKKKGFKDGLVVVADQGLLSLAAFLSSILLARSVSVDDYSVYVLALTVMLFVSGFMQSIVSIPFTIVYPKLDDSYKVGFKASVFIISILISLIVVVVIYCFFRLTGIKLFSQYSVDFNAFMLSAIVIPFALRENYRALILALLKVWRGFWVNLFTASLQIFFLSFLYLTNQLNLVSFFVVLIFFNSFAMLFLGFDQYKDFKFSNMYIFQTFKRCLVTGRWNLANFTLFSAASQSLPWLILFFVDDKSVAVYGVAIAVSSVAAPLIKGISSYLLPRMSHGVHANGNSELVLLVKKSMLAILFPCLLWVVLVIFFGDTIVRLLYSETYSGYGLVLTVVTIKFLVESISSPLTSALQSIGEVSSLTLAFFITLVITITLGIPMLIKYGLPGIVLTSLLSSIVSLLIRWVLFRRYIYVS